MTLQEIHNYNDLINKEAAPLLDQVRQITMFKIIVCDECYYQFKNTQGMLTCNWAKECYGELDWPKFEEKK